MFACYLMMVSLTAVVALQDPGFHAGGVAGAVGAEQSQAQLQSENAELQEELRLMTENHAIHKENAEMKGKLQQIADLLEDLKGGQDSQAESGDTPSPAELAMKAGRATQYGIKTGTNQIINAGNRITTGTKQIVKAGTNTIVEAGTYVKGNAESIAKALDERKELEARLQRPETERAEKKARLKDGAERRGLQENSCYDSSNVVNCESFSCPSGHAPRAEPIGEPAKRCGFSKSQYKSGELVTTGDFTEGHLPFGGSCVERCCSVVPEGHLCCKTPDQAEGEWTPARDLQCGTTSYFGGNTGCHCPPPMQQFDLGCSTAGKMTPTPPTMFCCAAETVNIWVPIEHMVMAGAWTCPNKMTPKPQSASKCHEIKRGAFIVNGRDAGGGYIDVEATLSRATSVCTLRARATRGFFVKDMDVLTRTDSYFVLKVRDEKHTSQVINNKLFPVWTGDEALQVVIACDRTVTMTVELWDKDTNRDDIVGHGSVVVPEVSLVDGDMVFLRERVKTLPVNRPPGENHADTPIDNNRCCCLGRKTGSNGGELNSEDKDFLQCPAGTSFFMFSDTLGFKPVFKSGACCWRQNSGACTNTLWWLHATEEKGGVITLPKRRDGTYVPTLEKGVVTVLRVRETGPCDSGDVAVEEPNSGDITTIAELNAHAKCCCERKPTGAPCLGGFFAGGSREDHAEGAGEGEGEAWCCQRLWSGSCGANTNPLRRGGDTFSTVSDSFDPAIFQKAAYGKCYGHTDSDPMASLVATYELDGKTLHSSAGSACDDDDLAISGKTVTLQQVHGVQAAYFE